MEIRQYGDTVCICFSIRAFHIEGMIRKVRRTKKQKQENPLHLECMLEHQAALEQMEQKKWAAQDLLRMKNLF